jgi:tetratricopeptide (TPR) repeat protein
VVAWNGDHQQGASSETAWLERLVLWSDAVIAHEPGRVDAPLRDLATWSADDVLHVVEDFLRVLPAWRDSRPGGPVLVGKRIIKADEVRRIRVLTDVAPETVNRTLRRAAMLHADVALHAPLDASTVTGRAASSVVQDGVFVRPIGVSEHWPAARTLLDGVAPSPALDPFVAEWYRTTAATLLQRGNLAAAGTHIEHARTRLRPDAEILFQDGYYHQASASATILAYQLQRAASFTGRPAQVERGRRQVRLVFAEHRANAEARFREAVALDPGHLEARVRLGWALVQRDRVAQAEPHLRCVAASQTEPTLAYVARLLLGRVQERAGQVEAARKNYEAASKLFPAARSPRFALAAMDRRLGRRADAWLAVAESVTPPIQEQDRADPWWTFDQWQSVPAADRLARLYSVLATENAR